MHTRWKKYIPLLLILLVFAIAGCQASFGKPAAAAGVTPPPDIIPPPGQYPSIGWIGTSLTLPDGSATLTLLSTEPEGSIMHFQFKVQNHTSAALAVLKTGGDYQFIIPLQKSVNYATATPIAATDLSIHPALPTTLAAQATATGWVDFDISALGYVPIQVDYKYATVPAIGCTDPADQSTCHPANLYKSLTWYLTPPTS